MGITLTDVLLFGKAQLDNVDNATLVIYRRNILQFGTIGRILEIVVKGVPPLVLPDAIDGDVVSLKAFGGTIQGGLPVPPGYTSLDYIETSSTQYIDTGLKGTQNTKVELKTLYYTQSSISGAGRLFGSRRTGGPNVFVIGANGAIAPTTRMFMQFGTNSASTDVMADTDIWFTFVLSRTIHTINGVQYDEPYTEETFETPQNLKLMAFDSNGSTRGGVGRCAYCKIWENDVLVRYFVPAKRNSDSVVGMIDVVNNVFYENAGTGTFSYGNEYAPSPTTPVDITCNNGVLKIDNQGNVYADGLVETIGIKTKNLFNKDTITTGYYIDASGTITESAYAAYSALIPVTPGKTYTYSGIADGSVAAKRMHGYLDGVWVQQIDYVSATARQPFTLTATIPDGINAIRISGRTADANVLVEYGSTQTDYVEYNDSSATCEMLLSVGAYTDNQEVISGTVTRNVGIKVLDGSEAWVEQGGQYVFADGTTDRLASNVGGFCNYFPVKSFNLSETETCIMWATNNIRVVSPESTVENFKTWLSSHNLIILYAKNTSVTETVTAQPMNTVAGDNTVEITQASMSGLELEVTYNAGVVLTIEEVEDTQLSPDVEVIVQ